jgi:hypothetical protein
MTIGQQLGALLFLTIRDPRRAMRSLQALDLPATILPPALALMAVASALLLHLGLASGLMPLPADPLSQSLFGAPLTTAVIQLTALVIAVLLIRSVGALFGGHGSLADAALAVVWLQVVLLALQAAQFLLYLLVPPLAPVIGLASMVVFFWFLTAFVAEIHGFSRSGLVLLGILGTFILLAILLSIVLALTLDPEVLNV